MEIKTQKFNGKIYGKKGSYSIYVNNTKVEVTDQEVEEYNNFLKAEEELRRNFTIEGIRINLEDFCQTKTFIIANYEQLIEAKNNITVETLFKGDYKDSKGEVISGILIKVGNSINTKFYFSGTQKGVTKAQEISEEQGNYFLSELPKHIIK